MNRFPSTAYGAEPCCSCPADDSISNVQHDGRHHLPRPRSRTGSAANVRTRARGDFLGAQDRGGRRLQSEHASQVHHERVRSVSSPASAVDRVVSHGSEPGVQGRAGEFGAHGRGRVAHGARVTGTAPRGRPCSSRRAGALPREHRHASPRVAVDQPNTCEADRMKPTAPERDASLGFTQTSSCAALYGGPAVSRATVVRRVGEHAEPTTGSLVGPAAQRPPCPMPAQWVPPEPENATPAEREAWLRHCQALRGMMGSGN